MLFTFRCSYIWQKLKHMNEKKLIERNLPFSGVYVFESITRGSIEAGMVCGCDNCGKLITNMVHVTEKNTGKKYTIGTDCSETLSKVGSMREKSFGEYQTEIYSFNLVLRFITEFNKGSEVQSIWEGMKYSIKKVLKNGKHSTVEVFRNDLEKWFPDVLNQLEKIAIE